MNPPASARSVDEQGAPPSRVKRSGGSATSSARVPYAKDSGPRQSGTEEKRTTAKAAAAPAKDGEKASRRDAPAPKARARHAHLFVTHFDPWSVMKNAFMMSLAVAIVFMVAVSVLWTMLALSGTFDTVTRTLTDIAGGGANTLDMANLFAFSRVIGVTAVLAVLEVILVTALATLFAFLYNIAVGITGGLQVTLTDDS